MSAKIILVLHIVIFYNVQFKNNNICYLFCALKMFNRFLNRAFIKKFQDDSSLIYKYPR